MAFSGSAINRVPIPTPKRVYRAKPRGAYGGKSPHFVSSRSQWFVNPSRMPPVNKTQAIDNFWLWFQEHLVDFEAIADPEAPIWDIAIAQLQQFHGMRKGNPIPRRA